MRNILHYMRITVEIDDKKIAKIVKATGQKKKSPAVAQALDEYLEDRKRKDFLTKVLSGKTDYAASNEELEGISSLER